MTETDSTGTFEGDETGYAEESSGGSYDDPAEEDGVLDPSDSLDSDDLRADALDQGVDAGDAYSGVNRFGTTLAEERQGESLSDLLAEEEPEIGRDLPWSDEENPTDDGRVPERRAGRLLASDESSGAPSDPDSVATEVGPDGGGASAEEAAVHLTDDPPFHPALS